ncbi:MAG: DUF2292 domain-containing protein [Nitrospirota bacterium]|nr:DUF2292 domain-containing protein [Nitrospirota bacterium]MDE3242323.1 DUF2292 domain-containing protein [Nitrospirota bacterium]
MLHALSKIRYGSIEIVIHESEACRPNVKRNSACVLRRGKTNEVLSLNH